MLHNVAWCSQKLGCFWSPQFPDPNSPNSQYMDCIRLWYFVMPQELECVGSLAPRCDDRGRPGHPWFDEANVSNDCTFDPSASRSAILIYIEHQRAYEDVWSIFLSLYNTTESKSKCWSKFWSMPWVCSRLWLPIFWNLSRPACIQPGKLEVRSF